LCRQPSRCACCCIARRAEHVAVERQRSLRRPFQRELVEPALPSGRAQALTKRGILRQSAQRRGQGVGVARRHQQTGFAIANDIRDAGTAQVTCHDRQRGAHRLEQHHAERFAAIDRGQAEHFSIRVQGVQRGVVDAAGKVHARLEAALDGARLQVPAAFAVADQYQFRLRYMRQRIQQHVEALVVAEPADGKHAQCTRTPSGRRRRGLIDCVIAWRDAQRNDPHLVAPWRERGAGVEIVGGRGDHGARAFEQRLFPRFVEPVADAQARMPCIGRNIGVPVHDPRQAARGAQQQRAESRCVRHVQMQQLGSKAADELRQPPWERRTQRHVHQLPMAGRQRNVDVVAAETAAAMRARFGVREHGGFHTARRQRGSEIGTAALDPAGMRRKKLADVQDAHGRARSRAQRRPAIRGSSAGAGGGDVSPGAALPPRSSTISCSRIASFCASRRICRSRRDRSMSIFNMRIRIMPMPMPIGRIGA